MHRTKEHPDAGTPRASFFSRLAACNAWLNRTLVAHPPAWLIGGLVFLAALCLRLWYLNPGFFHHDAVLLARAMEAGAEQGRLLPVLDGRYGWTLSLLPFRQLAVWLRLPLDTTLNTATAGAGAACSLVLFLLVRQLLRKREGSGEDVGPVGFVAGLLLACSPIFLSVTTHTMAHGWALLWVLLSFWLCAAAVDRNKPAPAFLAALCFVMAVATRFPNILLAPALAMLLLRGVLLPWPREVLRMVVSPVGLALLAPLTAGLAGLVIFQWDALAAKAGYDKFLGLFSRHLPYAWAGLTHTWSMPGMALAAAGVLVAMRRMGWAAACSLAFWFAVMFFFYGNISTYAHRFLVPALPPVAVFLALSTAWLLRRSVILGIPLLLFFLGGMLLVVHPVLDARRDFCGPKAFALNLAAHTEADALVLAMDDWVFVEWYAGRETATHPVGATPEDLQRWLNRIEAAALSGRPVYIIETGYDYDFGRHFKRLLHERFTPANARSFAWENYHKSSLHLRQGPQRVWRLQVREE